MIELLDPNDARPSTLITKVNEIIEVLNEHTHEVVEIDRTEQMKSDDPE